MGDCKEDQLKSIEICSHGERCVSIAQRIAWRLLLQDMIGTNEGLVY